MKPPITRSSKIVYKGFFDLRTDEIERQDGALRDYTSVHLAWNASVVIAQDKEGRYILNREFRQPIGKIILGCPGGTLDEGETPLVGAQRELYEETGYWADDITLIGSCYPIPSICNQIIYYFYAKNAVLRGEKKLDPFEFIETELKTEEELHREMRDGALVDSMLCTALWYKSLAKC